MSTIDDLKAKALAIAENYPGPWEWDEQGWLCGPDPKGDPDCGMIIVDSPEHSTGTVAEYLEAIDPVTILALIEELDEARREVCEMVANASAKLPFVPRGPEHVAQFRGWTGLYPKSASSALTGESDGEIAHTDGEAVYADWRTGVIPADGWYYVRFMADYPVWLRAQVTSEGYQIHWSPGPEDAPRPTVSSLLWRPAYQQLTPAQAQALLDDLRRVPSPGDWGVLEGDEQGPYGTRPVDWRGTKEQAAELALSMGCQWIAEVVSVPGGFSYETPHDVSESKLAAAEREFSTSSASRKSGSGHLPTR